MQNPLKLQDGVKGLNRRELIFKALAGLGGGAVGWLPVEIATNGHSLTERPTTSSEIATYLTMAILSGLIGGAIVGTQSQNFALNAQNKRRFLIGFVVCFVLSLPATYYSNLAFSYILAAGGWGVDHPGSLFYLFIARLVGWSLMGALLGVGVGLASGTLGNAIKGAAGGWVGGFVGGLAFDAIGSLVGGLMARLVGFSLVGLSIGLFIGLVQELTKSAWLKVEAGRLRGREYRLDRAVSNLGKAEENEVGLFGDPSVVAKHARIDRQGANFVLKDLSNREGTYLNGERIESAELREGDKIEIGGYELAFHVRSGGAGDPARVIAAARSPLPSPDSSPAASQNGTPCLVDWRGRRFPINASSVIKLGRALDNDVIVEHQSVSRHHAELSAAGGKFHLRDLNSQNGTFVRGDRITQTDIADGESLRLGDAELTLHT
jgi:pSer/pThr/pTyr-binding forkhead associated (FHA) protein